MVIFSSKGRGSTITLVRLTGCMEVRGEQNMITSEIFTEKRRAKFDKGKQCVYC
jgi:hypothetical protein